MPAAQTYPEDAGQQAESPLQRVRITPYALVTWG